MIDPVQKLYDALEADEVERVRSYRPSGQRFRASEAADCSRKIWYRLAGYIPAPRTVKLEMSAKSGNLHHDYVRHLLHAYGIELGGLKMNADGTVDEDPNVYQEYERDGVKFTVSGRSDGTIQIGCESVDGHATLEIKSVGFWSYDKMVKAGELGTAALQAYLLKNCKSYIYQGTVMAMLQDREYVYLMVVKRDSLEVGVFDATLSSRTGALSWKVDPELVEGLLKKFARIQKAVNAGTPPAPEYTEGSQECNQCSFLIYCHEARKRRERGLIPYVLYPIEGVYQEMNES